MAFRKPHGSNRDRGEDRFSKKTYGASRTSGDAPVRLHQATCSQCGKACEVPFKPNGKKPVYCRDCFGGHKMTTPATSYAKKEFAPKEFSAPAMPSRPNDQVIADLKRQLEMVHNKVDRIMQFLEVNKPAPKPATPEVSEEAIKDTVVKKRIVVSKKLGAKKK